MAENIGQDLPVRTANVPEAPKPKEGLSDQELGNLLSAVGNNEAKAITLLAMRGGNIFNRGGLYRAVLDVQGENEGWKMARNVPFDYCSYSLSPIGLVAEETIDQWSGTYGYQITEKGQELGIPLAGLLLDFSERNDISLSKLFGATVSSAKATQAEQESEEIDSRKRAPLTTLKILRELVTSPALPIRETDIAEAIGEKDDKSILPSLVRLSESSFIQYESRRVNMSFAQYKIKSHIPEGELPVYANDKTLTNLVFQTAKDNPDKFLSSREIYDLFPRDQKEAYRKRANLTGHISGILSFLRRNNYLELEKFSGKKMSEINLTQDQRIILTELLEILDRFQNKDPEILEKGRKSAEAIMSNYQNPQRASNILRLVKESSPHANQRSILETQKDILSILHSHPLGITNEEILNILKEQDYKFGRKAVTQMTLILEKQGSVRVEKQGSAKRFFPISDSQPS